MTKAISSLRCRIPKNKSALIMYSVIQIWNFQFTTGLKVILLTPEPYSLQLLFSPTRPTPFPRTQVLQTESLDGIVYNTQPEV